MTNDPNTDGAVAVLLWATAALLAAIGSALALAVLIPPRRPKP